jgi:type II secretory pathway component PulF
MPVIGPLLLRLELARISRTLAALLAGGIRIVEAVRATADTVGNRALRRTFEPIARGLTAGETLASGLEKTGMYPPLVINLVRTGEETGELPEMLNELATIYRDESERAVTGAVRLLEPMLILIMGGIIAGIVAAVILPIFQANMMVE